jgi:hypothetical protein
MIFMMDSELILWMMSRMKERLNIFRKLIKIRCLTSKAGHANITQERSQNFNHIRPVG